MEMLFFWISIVERIQATSPRPKKGDVAPPMTCPDKRKGWVRFLNTIGQGHLIATSLSVDVVINVALKGYRNQSALSLFTFKFYVSIHHFQKIFYNQVTKSVAFPVINIGG